MLNRKIFEIALIRGEKIEQPKNYNWETFYENLYTEQELEDARLTDVSKYINMFKENTKNLYECWLLDGYILASDKTERKEWLIERIKTAEDNVNRYKSFVSEITNKMEMSVLEALMELYNKYFSKEKECFMVLKDGKNAHIEWIVNKEMKLHTREEGFTDYKTYIKIEDYYNLKLNGEYTENKFTIFDKKNFVRFEETKNIILDIA